MQQATLKGNATTTDSNVATVSQGDIITDKTSTDKKYSHSTDNRTHPCHFTVSHLLYMY